MKYVALFHKHAPDLTVFMYSEGVPQYLFVVLDRWLIGFDFLSRDEASAASCFIAGQSTTSNLNFDSRSRQGTSMPV